MFMKPEITHKRQWYFVDGNGFFDVDYTTRDELKKEFPYADIELVEGYGGRLSASGYLDCTEWRVGESLRDVWVQLNESFDDDSEEWANAMGEILGQIKEVELKGGE